MESLNTTTSITPTPKAITTPTASGKSSLGKDDFLKLLITQLQNQDPSSPVDDKSTIAQLAQFSSLEQMQQLNQSFSQSATLQNINAFLGYAQLINKTVQYTPQNTTASATQTGIVKSISMKDGTIMMELDNGDSISADTIMKIS